LSWPIPDVIVPLPQSKIEKWSNSQQSIFLIAKRLAKWLNVDLSYPFKYDQQLLLKERASPFPEQTLLVLNLALCDEGQQICKAKKDLKKRFAKEVYSLSFIDHREETLSYPNG